MAFAYVLLLVLVALAVPFALSVSSRVEAEIAAQSESQAHLVAASAAGLLDRTRDLQSLVTRAGGELRGRVVIVGASGRLLADSAGTGLVGSAYGDRPEIAAALARGTVEQGRRRSETLDADLLFTAVPVVEDGERVGAVRITRTAATVDARIRRDRLALAGIAAAALVLGLALAWLVAGSLARPLHALARAARRVGEGDLDTRAEVAGPAEQREVATAFNEMADRLGRVLRAQSEFVANASHQLRTPLTGMRLRLEAASLKARDPELERELAAAERETERLAKVLTALLALAREGGDAGPVREVELASASRRARERWRAEAERGGRRLVLDGSAGVVAAAPEEDVAIILDNLVENALRYSPPATDVTIEWETRDGTAVLSVLDRGPGIPAGEAELVFERFARGSAGQGVSGTGLGLAIVRTLARRWGGDATVGDREGGGARVEVALRAATGSPSPARRAEVGVA